MLVKWENNDPEVRALWEKMNNWVYAGFDETYKKMGVGFDKIYYESQTYLKGKAKVEEGLAKGLFERHEDNSVWADLTNEGLDQKLLLRSDGTSVYMTQDIGTAEMRFQDYPIDITSKYSLFCWTVWASSGVRNSYTSLTVWWNCLTVR